MSEEEKIPGEGQKNEGVSPNNEHPLPQANEKLQTEVKYQKPAVKGSASTDNLKQPIKSNEDASHPPPATPSTLNFKPSTSIWKSITTGQSAAYNTY